MAKKNQKKSEKSEKSGKISVTLDETHQNITKKKTPKKSFLWPGRAEKGPKRVKKKGHLGALFVRKNGIPAIKWVQKGSKK